MLRYIENVRGIIQSPREDKYSAAEERLVNIFKENKEDKRIERLAIVLELGNEKPSQFLPRMKALAGRGKMRSVLKTLWINEMPHHQVQKSVLFRVNAIRT